MGLQAVDEMQRRLAPVEKGSYPLPLRVCGCVRGIEVTMALIFSWTIQKGIIR